jgi:hypothetical protein
MALEIFWAAASILTSSSNYRLSLFSKRSTGKWAVSIPRLQKDIDNHTHSIASTQSNVFYIYVSNKLIKVKP